MAQEALLEKVSLLLLKKGFTVKRLARSCFDLLARQERTILLIKLLEDANAVSKEYAEQMANLSSYLSASPLIVCAKAGGALQDQVVYQRFGIITLTYATFGEALDRHLPTVIRTKAGLTVQVAGDAFRKKREELGESLATIASKVGVSPRMVAKYEQGHAISFGKAKRLYNLLGPDVFTRIDVLHQHLHYTEEPRSGVSRKFASLGFATLEPKRVPFDVLAKQEKEIILTRIGDKPDRQLDPLSRLLDADRLAIFSKRKPKHIAGLSKEEFMDFESAQELIRFIKESNE
ncbi:helix-turn-helix domain-containing protein [Candidatus Woesearchaeota archaeon]|nr:helix-turn-helix domain-containing protein [Candidatus Woesearchaeota archaeon]